MHQDRRRRHPDDDPDSEADAAAEAAAEAVDDGSGSDDALLVTRGATPAVPVPPVQSGIRHSLRAFRHRDFAVFWCGALASNTGSWLSNLAVPYVLYEITGSAFWVGLVSLAQFLPGILLGPYGGALADGRNRRSVLLFTQSGAAVSALLLWACWASGWREPALVLVLVSLGGVFAGINMPSWQSFVNDLVPRRDLLSAVTLNSLQFNAARSLGPAIAGLLLAALGASWAFLLNGLSFVFVLAALTLVRPRPTRRFPPSTDAVTRQFVQAFGYVRRQPGLVVSLVVSVLVGALGNPIFSFTVVFARGVFEVGAAKLGLMNAALGVGAVLAAPLVSGWSHRISLSRVVGVGLALYGASLLAFGASPNYWFAVATCVVVGGCFLAVISAVNTTIQTIVADDMRGRVMAVRIVFYTASFPTGALALGSLSDWLGPRVAMATAGAGLLVATVALVLWRGPARLERLNDPHDETGVAARSR